MMSVRSAGSWLQAALVALAMSSVACGGGDGSSNGASASGAHARGGPASTVSFCESMSAWSKQCGHGNYDATQCEQQTADWTMDQLAAATQCTQSQSCDATALDQCLGSAQAAGGNGGGANNGGGGNGGGGCIDVGTLTSGYWQANGNSATMQQIQFNADGTASMELSNVAGGDAWYNCQWTLACPSLDVTCESADATHFTVQNGQLADGSSPWIQCSGKCF